MTAGILIQTIQIIKVQTLVFFQGLDNKSCERLGNQLCKCCMCSSASGIIMQAAAINSITCIEVSAAPVVNCLQKRCMS